MFTLGVKPRRWWFWVWLFGVEIFWLFFFQMILVQVNSPKRSNVESILSRRSREKLTIAAVWMTLRIYIFLHYSMGFSFHLFFHEIYLTTVFFFIQSFIYNCWLFLFSSLVKKLSFCQITINHPDFMSYVCLLIHTLSLSLSDNVCFWSVFKVGKSSLPPPACCTRWKCFFSVEKKIDLQKSD